MKEKNKKLILVGIIVVLAVVVISILMILLLPKTAKKEVISSQTLSYGFIENADFNRDMVNKYKDRIIKDENDYDEVLSYYGLSDKNEVDFKNNNYLVIIAEQDYCGGNINNVSTTIDDNKIKVRVGLKVSCGPCPSEFYLYLQPIAKNSSLDNYEVEYNYEKENNITCDPDVSYKPLIYLYPEKEMNVTVTLGNPPKLTTTYPKYKENWKVLAKPNGNLIDLETGRVLYGLYWEGLNTEARGIHEEGFIVRGEDTIDFLEEKLKVLGLSEREANEFIIYWLPKLEGNKYNYIYFETMEEINQNMPLEVSPKPTSIIRVNMEYKKLDKLIEVREQELTTPERTGFTVVEWGGTELK